MIRTLTIIMIFLATTRNPVASDTSSGEALEQCLNEHFNCMPNPYGQMKSIFPMYDCGCEKKFFVCLRNIQSDAADHVGTLYFAMNSQCTTRMHDKVSCLEYQSIFIMDEAIPISRCIRYLVDDSKNPDIFVADTNLYMNSSMQYYSPEYITTFQSKSFGLVEV